METLDASGHPIRPDQNGTFRGVMGYSDRGERQPTSVVWLAEEVRHRPNLRLMTGHHALRLLFDGSRATGAEAAAHSVVCRFACCGLAAGQHLLRGHQILFARGGHAGGAG
ncbi:MAG: GMC family oxidoreductase N-terminal domain-containing protein [Paenirhodobacter sp.]